MWAARTRWKFRLSFLYSVRERKTYVVFMVFVAEPSCSGSVLYVEHTEACVLCPKIENSCRYRCSISV